MLIETYPCDLKLLTEYATIPIAFEVRSIFQVQALENGLGGLRLVERPVSPPYIKDYDAYEDGPPTAWERHFNMQNWGFLLARQPGPADSVIADLPGSPIPATAVSPATAVGAAAIAWSTHGVNMLKGRDDLAMLWDIRVTPQRRGQGIGAQLLKEAANWARQRGCKTLKIETQNVNVPACRFYASLGCVLGDIRRFAYAGQAHVAHETMLIWYLRLA